MANCPIKKFIGAASLLLCMISVIVLPIKAHHTRAHTIQQACEALCGEFMGEVEDSAFEESDMGPSILPYPPVPPTIRPTRYPSRRPNEMERQYGGRPAQRITYDRDTDSSNGIRRYPNKRKPTSGSQSYPGGYRPQYKPNKGYVGKSQQIARRPEEVTMDEQVANFYRKIKSILPPNIRP